MPGFGVGGFVRPGRASPWFEQIGHSDAAETTSEPRQSVVVKAVKRRQIDWMKNLSANAPFEPQNPPLRLDQHGIIRVGNTRVTLDTVVASFEHGDTPEEIARNYDALWLGEVYQVIGYYLTHHEEIEKYIGRRLKERASIRKHLERRHNPIGIRQRLLARRRQAA
jgi:uncharacterized protein (DUF433 family)